MSRRKQEDYTAFDEARTNYIRQFEDPEKAEELCKDQNEAKKFLAVVMACMLDEDPEFIKLVSKYRRRFEDKLLIDGRLI